MNIRLVPIREDNREAGFIETGEVDDGEAAMKLLLSAE